MGSLLYTAERKEKTNPKPTPLIEEMSESSKKIGDTYSSRDVHVCIDSPVGLSLIQSLFGIMKRLGQSSCLIARMSLGIHGKQVVPVEFIILDWFH